MQYQNKKIKFLCKITVLSILLLFTIVSSAGTFYFKPGVEREEFPNDVEKCLVQAKTTSEYGACMGSKGWLIKDNDTYNNAVQECRKNNGGNYFDCLKNAGFDTQTKFMKDYQPILTEFRTLCDKSEYADLFKKMRCYSNQIKTEDMVDNSKINEVEKVQLLAYMKELAESRKKFVAAHRATGVKYYQKKADYFAYVLYPAEENLSIELYKQRINWGDYNQARKKISTDSQYEQKKMTDDWNAEIENKTKKNNENYALMTKGQVANEQQRAQQELVRKQNEAAANAVANRESQCRFAQSAEYLKFAPGGFFQSMQNANSVFENCMAGIPRQVTTCNKDVMGQVNCVTQ